MRPHTSREMKHNHDLHRPRAQKNSPNHISSPRSHNSANASTEIELNQMDDSYHISKEMLMEAAAVRIQALFRGHLARITHSKESGSILQNLVELNEQTLELIQDERDEFKDKANAVEQKNQRNSVFGLFGR